MRFQHTDLNSSNILVKVQKIIILKNIAKTKRD